MNTVNNRAGSAAPQHQTYNYMLADGAQFPDRIAPLLKSASDLEWRAVYAGTNDEAIGDAGIFLITITQWGVDPLHGLLEKMDREAPCLIVMRSVLHIDPLVKHLQAFLTAEIGEGMTSLIRYFDPRNLHEMVRIWDQQTRQHFLSPFISLHYRGHHEDWQHIDGLAGQHGARSQQAPAAPIVMNQAQQDQLIQHGEPDMILNMLVESRYLPGDQPYLVRYQDFLPRYQRGRAWRLSEFADLYHYCCLSYEFGLYFDCHPMITPALHRHIDGQQPMNNFQRQIPNQVWLELKAQQLANEPEGQASDARAKQTPT